MPALPKRASVVVRPPPQLAAVEAFVEGSSVQTSERSDAQTPETAGRAIVHRRDGRLLRRMTVYLPHELARRVHVACAEADRDVSDWLADLVRERLGT